MQPSSWMGPEGRPLHSLSGGGVGGGGREVGGGQGEDESKAFKIKQKCSSLSTY